MEKDYKSLVAEKLNLKDEIKKSKVKKVINSVQMVDGKITAEFTVELPKKKAESHLTDYNNYKKIFNTPQEFADYSIKFLQEEEKINNSKPEMGNDMAEGMGDDSLELPLNKQKV